MNAFKLDPCSTSFLETKKKNPTANDKILNKSTENIANLMHLKEGCKITNSTFQLRTFDLMFILLVLQIMVDKLLIFSILYPNTVTVKIQTIKSLVAFGSVS